MPTKETLDKVFPRYTDFSPKVPVWNLTPAQGGCIHRFFDTSPISPSGRYIALFRFPFEDRVPAPADKGDVIVIDLDTGAEIHVAETSGWESQLGANINWGGTDHELFFNDVDTATWRPFSWNVDFINGTRRPMNGAVYHASPDGRYLISANLTNSSRTQLGYGVLLPRDLPKRNIGPVEDDGFYLTDTRTGETKMLVSIADLWRRANPPMLLDNPEQYEFYGFHSKFNPQGDRLMLSVRAFPAHENPRWNMFAINAAEVEFAWFTLDLEAKEIHCCVGPEEWRKGGHHATFFPDGRRISMNLAHDCGPLRLMQVDLDGGNYRQIRDGLIGSGHPTVTPDGAHIITDSYAHESVAFGDGAVPIRWIDLRDGAEETLLRINVAQPHPDGAMRIDPHPAWDPTRRWVVVNAFLGGTRRVLLMDMSEASH